MVNGPSQQSNVPLEGDPARQAIDALRGYDYQIWRSVEAWMHLTDGQSLFLEGAEDFDIVSDSSAESTQIKLSGKNITLGSSDVRAAIENCWLLLERNSERESVTMRFLTRGGVGLEQAHPFGDEPGIELWRRAALGSDDAAARVAHYLKGAFKNAQLNQFLATAGVADLRERLIRHLVWITDEPGLEAAVIAVERLAIQLGRSCNIGSTDSLKALDGLLAHCRFTATRKPLELRSLTLEDKIRIFEEKTDIRIPGTRAMLTKLASSLTSAFASPSRGDEITFAPAKFGMEPSLPPFALPRSSLVRTIAESEKPVLIVGSEGRGKTTLASLAGSKLGGVNHWLDLSLTDRVSLPDMLERLLVELRNAETNQVVVIDDVPVADGIEQSVWVRISAIFTECKTAFHHLICTAKGVHPEAVDPRLRTAQIAICSVPDLSLPEIKDFVGSLDCPGALRDGWAELILAESGGGHPKLVHLRGLELRDEAWPEPTTGSAFPPPRSIEEARNFARREVAKALPNEERELLYAISLAFHPIERNAVLSIGAEFANLDTPGDTLDRLVGRWIETVGPSAYRTTALLAGQAASVWPKDKINRANASLFDALSSRQAISVDEAFPIFMHAWRSGDDHRAAGYLACLVNEQSAMHESLFEHLAPIIFVARRGDIVPEHVGSRTLALLRTIQFRVAQQEHKTELPSIADDWLTTLDMLPEGTVRDGGLLMRAFLITAKCEPSFSARTIVGALADLHRYRHMIPPDRQDEIAADLCPDGVVAHQDIVSTTFGFIYGQVESLDFLVELLDAMEATDARARQQMLRAFDIPLFRKNHLFVDGPFVAESRRKPPRWQLAAEILQRMIRLADEWQCSRLAISAGRTLSVVYDSHLDKHVEALECLREVASRFGESPTLEAQRGNVHFRAKDYEQALRIWNSSLWRPRSDIQGAEKDKSMLRSAGIAAGLRRDYSRASLWFEWAADAARDSGMTDDAFVGGALVDAAYCAFKDGAWSRAVSMMLICTES